MNALCSRVEDRGVVCAEGKVRHQNLAIAACEGDVTRPRDLEISLRRGDNE